MANIMDIFKPGEVKEVNFGIDSAKGVFEKIRKAQELVGGKPNIRVKVGSGGAKIFTVTKGSNEITIDGFSGVVVAHHMCNARFAAQDDGAAMNTPPICSSEDGVTGIVHETGECRDCGSCPYNVFGSSGKGKVCKNMHRLYIMLENCPIPVTLTLPPTSLELWRNYALMDVAAAGLDMAGVVTEFGLEVETSAAGQRYAVVTFKIAGTVNEEVKSYCTTVGEAMTTTVRPAISGEDYNRETLPEPTEEGTQDTLPDFPEPTEALPDWDEEAPPPAIGFDEL